MTDLLGKQVMTMTENNSKYFGADALRYAQALIELEITEDTLTEIENTFLKVPELMDIFQNPSVSFEHKKNIIDKVFTDEISKNLLKVILSHGDLDLLFEILNACNHLIKQKNKTLVGVIYCVTPPSDEQLDKFKNIIMKKHHCKDVLWQIIEDKNLISGFILQVAGVEYDYSLKSRIDRLKSNLTGR